MIALLTGTALLSVFHALIPSHWLPVIAVAQRQHWATRQTLSVTLMAGAAHVLSTVLLGGIFAAIGGTLAKQAESFTQWFAPVILTLMGLFYIYQHYYHHHFHLHQQRTHWGLVASLALAMFLSPCLEIEGFFLVAGSVWLGICGPVGGRLWRGDGGWHGALGVAGFTWFASAQLAPLGA